MPLSTKVIGCATFTYDYFLKGGFIGCSCPNCSAKIEYAIKIFDSGKLVEKLSDRLIIDLLKKRVINEKDESLSWHSHLRQYILFGMNALYEFIHCPGYDERFLTIFGMAEIQPGREEVQFKGIWRLD